MKVNIYTNPHCPHSKKTLTFFRRRKIKFEELTLFKEAQNRFDVIYKTGMMSTPVIEIDDEIVVGFNEPRLKTLLKKKK